MTEEEFKQLQVGDVVHHPRTRTVYITQVHRMYDFNSNTRPYPEYTYAIEGSNGGYMKITDTHDLSQLTKVSQ